MSNFQENQESIEHSDPGLNSADEADLEGLLSLDSNWDLADNPLPEYTYVKGHHTPHASSMSLLYPPTSPTKFKSKWKWWLKKSLSRLESQHTASNQQPTAIRGQPLCIVSNNDVLLVMCINCII